MTLRTETIALGAFLKWAGLAPTGGTAKQLIEHGAVQVNGVAERRRGRRLRSGDQVSVGANTFVIRYPPSAP